ncbi:MAG: tyrosine--tRNA ligase [Rickettsiales bacterium]|nr:tyrosine--tRNA ligase [Rickettsiales bacterium]
MFQSAFLRQVADRGFIYQGTDNAALDALLLGSEKAKQPIACYIGFDCTAPSLHVGSLIQIMMLRHWQKAGHKPIVLMGGGTTKVGDPSGKDASRQLLTDEKIAENMAGIKRVFSQFLAFEDEKPSPPGRGETLVRVSGEGAFDPASPAAVMVNNDDWLSGLNYIAFLRDYGRLFSVNRMLSMESVKQRLERESHLSFLEFNYMVLQAYDFVELNKRYDCRLQIGGSDQWGNITQGINLHSRQRFGDNLETDPATSDLQDALLEAAAKANGIFGLTTPLLTTSSGAKMGKTASGAVWLNAELTSPYEYWQFWRNTEDADVGRFLRLFTELSIEKIEELEALPGSGINEAKKVLATEATALLHGRAAAEEAADTARQTFEEGITAGSLPSIEIAAPDCAPAYQLFVLAGLATSNNEARKLIAGGGARINDEKVEDATRAYSRDELLRLSPLKLSSGKKKHILLNVKAA